MTLCLLRRALGLMGTQNKVLAALRNQAWYTVLMCGQPHADIRTVEDGGMVPSPWSA